MITRIAETRDIPAIVDLLAVAFPEHGRSARHWEWSHSCGRGLAAVAEHDGRIVGHYSFGFQPFRWHGRTYKAGFGQQAAVHPGHRDLQTIVELIEFAEQASGCDFVFGFPNANMAPVKERLLGWEKVLTFRSWTLPMAGFARSAREARGEGIRRVATFSGLDFRPEEENGALAPVRTAEWLEWRYITHPLNHYACFTDGKGIMVLKAYLVGENRLGHILELQGQNEQDKLNLLPAAADYFEFMGVNRMVVWGRFKPNQSLYEDLGFQPSSITSSLYAKALTDGSRDVISADWSFDMGVSDVF